MNVILGNLPFSQTAAGLTFQIASNLYEHTSAVTASNLDWGDWSTDSPLIMPLLKVCISQGSPWAVPPDARFVYGPACAKFGRWFP